MIHRTTGKQYAKVYFKDISSTKYETPCQVCDFFAKEYLCSLSPACWGKATNGLHRSFFYVELKNNVKSD